MATRASKKAKAQMMILEEVKSQLILQAERWGRTEYYTPIKLEEMESDAAKRIRTDLLQERANLEYELQVMDANRREVEMKLSRLDAYLRRAGRVIKKHDKTIEKIIDRAIGDRKRTFGALDRVKAKTMPQVSVMISDN